MKISKWGKQKYPDTPPGYMIRVTRREAIRIIQSLSCQMTSNNMNVGREEFDTETGEYFSISVEEE